MRIEIRVTHIPARGTSDPWEVATAVVDGQEFTARSRSSCISALARLLVEAGVPDQPWQSVNAAGMVCLRGPSLHRLAGRTVSESDRGGLRAVKYQPRPPAAGGQERLPEVEPVAE
jgi:hypothetical protein